MEPIYSDEDVVYFPDESAHAYATAILERMRLDVEYCSCVIESPHPNMLGSSQQLVGEKDKSYLIGVSKNLTEENVQNALLVLAHECGHVYLMEKHPVLDKILIKASSFLKPVDSLREYISYKIGIKYARGLTPGQSF